MTQRQKDLIEYLATNETKEFTQKEVCDNVNGYTYTDDIRNHCAEIWQDVNEINNDPTIECFIQYKKYKCKIANRNEVKAMIVKKMNNALKEWSRYWYMKRKAEKHNFLTIDFDNEYKLEALRYFNDEKDESDEND